MSGRNLKIKSNLFMQALRIGPAEREEFMHREFVERIIDFLEIQPFRKTPVGQLPYGLQKRVDLGRALAMEPQVLLLDEPMAGMGAEETDRMLELLAQLKAGHAILLVEHDMDAIFRIADYITVMVNGCVIATDTPEQVRLNPTVQAAYLGEH
jgi:branched-chain amino acid transport system ATP-binding protein